MILTQVVVAVVVIVKLIQTVSLRQKMVPKKSRQRSKQKEMMDHPKKPNTMTMMSMMMGIMTTIKTTQTTGMSNTARRNVEGEEMTKIKK